MIKSVSLYGFLIRGGGGISIYNRLLSLYKKNGSLNKTPLEDYTTELLVGLLEDNQAMLDDFANSVLKIEGEGFNIESQNKYILPGDINCIIDMVVTNKDSICFIENKVNASEGERQLERYAAVLRNIKSKENKEIYLRHCTKYYDKKEIKNFQFKQYRWSDVYKFLLKIMIIK